MKLRFPVRMLVIDRSPAEAAALVAALRRANYVVYPNLARDLDTVREITGKTRLDLVLIGHNIAGAPIDAEERTLAWLVDHSRERLAITRGDDIIAANNGFLDLFGLESVELPWRDGLLECVADNERDELRTFLETGREERPIAAGPVIEPARHYFPAPGAQAG